MSQTNPLSIELLPSGILSEWQEKIPKAMGNLQISPKRMHGSSLRNTIPCQRLYKFWEEPYVAARLGRKDRVMLTAGCKPESMHFMGVGKITSQGKETDCPLKGSELTSPNLSKHTDRQLRPILNF